MIFFHAEGFEGYRGYSGTLPRGLCFDHSRATVRAALGVPAGTGTGHKNDRWDTEKFYMTLDFADDERKYPPGHGRSALEATRHPLTLRAPTLVPADAN